ncbi:MAG: alanine dehydrogenase, partial [Bacteroidota bacterium]
MLTIALIREGKIPADNRVALTPAQCKWLKQNSPDINILVQPSPTRCFPDKDYAQAGAIVSEEIDKGDVLLGIKEVPKEQLIANKTYLFFSHTKKAQPHNKPLMLE